MPKPKSQANLPRSALQQGTRVVLGDYSRNFPNKKCSLIWNFSNRSTRVADPRRQFHPALRSKSDSEPVILVVHPGGSDLARAGQQPRESTPAIPSNRAVHKRPKFTAKAQSSPSPRTRRKAPGADPPIANRKNAGTVPAFCSGATVAAPGLLPVLDGARVGSHQSSILHRGIYSFHR